MVYLLFLPGYLTGSVYYTKYLKAGCFPGESIQTGEVIAIKTHRFGPRSQFLYDRAILLMRQPTGSILSEVNRQLSGKNQTGKADPRIFNHPGKFKKVSLTFHMHVNFDILVFV